jgi:hypothetical protein
MEDHNILHKAQSYQKLHKNIIILPNIGTFAASAFATTALHNMHPDGTTASKNVE